MKCSTCDGCGFVDNKPCAKCSGCGKLPYVFQPSPQEFESAPTLPGIPFKKLPKCTRCQGDNMAPFLMNEVERAHCWDCGTVSAKEWKHL